jgi:hypothetical protein
MREGVVCARRNATQSIPATRAGDLAAHPATLPFLPTVPRPCQLVSDSVVAGSEHPRYTALRRLCDRMILSR